ncbi:MAG TPA: IS701 family transposase [Streptosporangiaceae bacterium]|nr:IS701 family transposase [Streptosporangiaceae bacterium]
MKTAKPKAAAAARIGAALGRRKRAELLDLLRPCFARTEPWLQAGKYAAAVMCDLRRRNGWTIAERAGDRTPDRTQPLLNRAVRDAFAAMGVVRRFAVAGLDQAARTAGRRRGLAVGAIDETGQVKAGVRTAGVKRQYLGCAGKVANGNGTVHLAYAREGTGHALIGAREWIPARHIGDPVTSAVMGLPEDLPCRTKGQLAIDILADAFAGGVRLDFVCGDEVYGSCTELREYCENRDQAYVLRVPCSFRLALPGGLTLTCQQAAARLGRRRGWEVRSAGTGSKGQRWYAWAWLATASRRHHLLIRRHLTTGELAYHYCYLPEGQPASPSRPVRAAGLRWPAEEDFAFGKDCFGLDQSQVRLYTAIARHTVLVMAALAICAVTAALLRHRTSTAAPAPALPDQPRPAEFGMIPLTVPETGRLLARPPPPGSTRHWLDWRRSHQARSRWYHQRTRLARDTAIVLVS